jgi:hypothetical protein
VTSQDALCSFFEARGIKSRDESFEEWFRHDWARINLFGRRVPVKPIYGFKRVLILHDLHHLLTGYDTTWTGELEVAAWELGSGGCGSHFLFWYNRIFYTLLVVWLAPRRAWRAFQRGRTQRNLYRLDHRDVLGREIDELRAWSASPTRP